MGLRLTRPSVTINSNLLSSLLLLDSRARTHKQLTKWMPSERRCSPSRERLILFMLPLPGMRKRPRKQAKQSTSMSVILEMLATLEEREKSFTNAEEEVSALTRRIMLMEEEAKKADSNLAETVTKLAMASKDADGILKKVKYFENKTIRNEVEIEEADKNLRETTKMASDNEQKLDELTRKLGVQEDELKRANERAELAEGKLRDVE